MLLGFIHYLYGLRFHLNADQGALIASLINVRLRHLVCSGGFLNFQLPPVYLFILLCVLHLVDIVVDFFSLLVLRAGG